MPHLAHMLVALVVVVIHISIVLLMVRVLKLCSFR
jgi:hypothetical protein